MDLEKKNNYWNAIDYNRQWLLANYFICLTSTREDIDSTRTSDFPIPQWGLWRQTDRGITRKGTSLNITNSLSIVLLECQRHLLVILCGVHTATVALNDRKDGIIREGFSNRTPVVWGHRLFSVPFMNGFEHSLNSSIGLHKKVMLSNADNELVLTSSDLQVKGDIFPTEHTRLKWLCSNFPSHNDMCISGTQESHRGSVTWLTQIVHFLYTNLHFRHNTVYDYSTK